MLLLKYLNFIKTIITSSNVSFVINCIDQLISGEYIQGLNQLTKDIFKNQNE